MTLTLLIVAGALALGDWFAVDRRRPRLELALKPATLAVLIAAAATAHLGSAKPWIVAALAFGLVGDLGLLRAEHHERDAPGPGFLGGLGAFLIGHVLYVIAFATAGLHGLALLAGALVVGGIAGLSLPQVLRGASAQVDARFAGVVAAYSGVLGAMAVLAVGTQHPATAIGGVLFLVSDVLIARSRFVAPVRRGPLLVIATYHLAQFLIVIGLLERL